MLAQRANAAAVGICGLAKVTCHARLARAVGLNSRLARHLLPLRANGVGLAETLARFGLKRCGLAVLAAASILDVRVLACLARDALPCSIAEFPWAARSAITRVRGSASCACTAGACEAGARYASGGVAGVREIPLLAIAAAAGPYCIRVGDELPGEAWQLHLRHVHTRRAESAGRAGNRCLRPDGAKASRGANPRAGATRQAGGVAEVLGEALLAGSLARLVLIRPGGAIEPVPVEAATANRAVAAIAVGCAVLAVRAGGGACCLAATAEGPARARRLSTAAIAVRARDAHFA